MPGRARLRARRHRRHHREGERRDGRPAGCQGERGAQADAEPPRIRVHGPQQQGQGGRIHLRVGDAVPGRPVLPLPVQALRRRAPGIRARTVDSGVRRRSRQLQLPALEPRLQPDARLRERQAGAHARLPAVARRRAASGRPGLRARPSRQHQPPAHRRAAEVSARRCLSGLHRPQLRAARPDDRVGENRRRAATHRATKRCWAWRTRSRSTAAWSPRCWTTG